MLSGIGILPKSDVRPIEAQYVAAPVRFEAKRLGIFTLDVRLKTRNGLWPLLLQQGLRSVLVKLGFVMHLHHSFSIS